MSEIQTDDKLNRGAEGCRALMIAVPLGVLSWLLLAAVAYLVIT